MKNGSESFAFTYNKWVCAIQYSSTSGGEANAG